MKHSSGDGASVGFSEACERNKASILEVLQVAFKNAARVLEVGSGTGQHAVHFARSLPQLIWQPADQREYLPALKAGLELEVPVNISAAIELDVRMSPWPVAGFDGVFSANTLHYMGVDCVEAFFSGVGQTLRPDGILVVYGPFNYAGRHTSDSNVRFDEWLSKSDPVRGIRDFEWVNDLAALQQLELLEDLAMPANNRCLVWRRKNVL
jgi:cyclopropane fatty-acyl-phospholipid synthase-like methyltransferase